MSGPEGGFYSSFDADSGGIEGSYYVWTPDEINEVAGPDGPALNILLGVTDEGKIAGLKYDGFKNKDKIGKSPQ
jgi:uncharacterized protein YyaL (SSP411 family)